MNAKRFYLDTYGEQRDYTFSAQDMVDFAVAYAKQQSAEQQKRIDECEHSILTTPTSTGTYHKQCYKCGKQF